jgi:DnaJ-class molecular chaperone
MIIKIPTEVRDGQTIRLKGVAQGNTNGAIRGDLYLKVLFRKSLFEKLKALLHKRPAIKGLDKRD